MNFVRVLPAIVTVMLTLGVSAGHAASVAPYDSQWLQQSIAGDRFEIQAAKLAIRRSHNGHLGALAGRLLSDHTKALREATALARLHHVPVAPTPTPGMSGVLNLLRTLPDSAFAREYATFEIEDHDDSIVAAGMEVKNGRTKDISKFADGQSTMLAKHLRLARQTLRAL